MISDEPIEKVKKTLKRNNYGFNFYVCEEKLNFNVRPVTMFYDKNHVFTEKHIGTIEKQRLAAKLNNMVN